MWSGQRHASWDDLCNVSHLRFNNLVFADDAHGTARCARPCCGFITGGPDKPETRFMWCTLGPRSLDDKHGERPAAALQPVLRRFAQQHRTLGGFAVDDQVRGEVGRPVRSCVPQEQASGAARTSRTQGERQEHAIDMANIARVLARIGRRRHWTTAPVCESSKRSTWGRGRCC